MKSKSKLFNKYQNGGKLGAKAASEVDSNISTQTANKSAYYNMLVKNKASGDSLRKKERETSYKQNESTKKYKLGGVIPARMNKQGKYEDDSTPAKGENLDKYKMRKEAQSKGESTYNYKGKSESSGIKTEDSINKLKDKTFSSKVEKKDLEIKVTENKRPDVNVSYKSTGNDKNLSRQQSPSNTQYIASRTVNNQTVSTNKKPEVNLNIPKNATESYKKKVNKLESKYKRGK